jgi:hypothetical protein
MWEKYFTYAELHFLDYSPQFLQYYSNRSAYHYMNQTDKSKMKEFAEKFGPFDVIIDDASHRFFQKKKKQVFTWKIAFKEYKLW